jgi:hypothetical protein
MYIAMLILNFCASVSPPGLFAAGRTTLFYAAHSEHAAVVKYLLDHGADPDKADEGGISPLHCAAGTGPLSIHMYLCFARVHHTFFLFVCNIFCGRIMFLLGFI